jgi:hypothetical protein
MVRPSLSVPANPTLADGDGASARKAMNVGTA